MSLRDEIAHRLCALLDDEWSEGKRLYLMEADAIMALFRDRFGSELEAERARVVELERALTSIARNTCCDTCREAALVARAALTAHTEARATLTAYRAAMESGE